MDTRIDRALKLLLRLGKIRQVFMGRLTWCLANNALNKVPYVNPKPFPLLNYNAWDMLGVVNQQGVDVKPISDIVNFNITGFFNDWVQDPTPPPGYDFVQEFRNQVLNLGSVEFEEGSALTFTVTVNGDAKLAILKQINTTSGIVYQLVTEDGIVLAQTDIGYNTNIKIFKDLIAGYKVICNCNEQTTYIDLMISQCSTVVGILEDPQFKGATVMIVQTPFEYEGIGFNPGEVVAIYEGLMYKSRKYELTELTKALETCGRTSCQLYGGCNFEGFIYSGNIP